MELQVIRGQEYHEMAQTQHFGGVVLPAKRGEILSRNTKTGETSILATNTTLDLVYVDPLITDDPSLVAETLADILVTDESHTLCSNGDIECPRELIEYYASAFDPLARVQTVGSGILLEPERLRIAEAQTSLGAISDITEVRRQFARDIEERISGKRVTYVPLVYGATKIQMDEISSLSIPGIEVSREQRLIYANPEDISQTRVGTIARQIETTLQIDAEALRSMLRSRPLRYVAIMRRLPPKLSSTIREAKLQSLKTTREAKQAAATREAADAILDPLRSIALLPEHWRFYPDGTVASHVVGFLNATQDAQYGVERTFDPQLRGQEGLISTVSDPLGGQILTAEQTVIDPKDGDTIVMTIDRFIQQHVESIMMTAIEEYEAESAQAIVMDPYTGKILAMVNVPTFDSNNYGDVYTREPIYLDEGKRKTVVVEVLDPDDNSLVVRGYIGDVFTEEGRAHLSEERKARLAELETLFDLTDMVRYYLYVGENQRWEVFPTDQPDIWLRFSNRIGVGAYLNRSMQAIYEPGSVMKPITMSIAIDQGEVVPSDTYVDSGPVRVDEYTIKNALNSYYGEVTMTNCIEYSINTCMTSVSAKLGKKLFHRMLERFGFGKVTGIELEDEQAGEMAPWRDWSDALLATSAYGQGISATPLQVVTAFSVLANGGKLVKPTIIDSIIHNDGTVEKNETKVLDQIITPETAATITAMLTSSVRFGFAKVAAVPGYHIAGKTGTSQVAGPGGRYESGTGSTIASFAGYAPIDRPRFVILVKFDRPHRDIYGSQTAGPIFGDIAAFLFKYYGIPPDAED
jgi:cell division protein FtsI/penicillin-binding protein 2